MMDGAVRSRMRRSGPPFHVTVWRGAIAVKLMTFDTHDAATEFAIAEMNLVLGPSDEFA
jgi:hypothetical protein